MSIPSLIFAAGFGTRMGDLTKDTPKPLIRVGGRALIDYALDIARGVDAAPIVANTHYLADQMAAYLAPQNVILSHEADILETGGGLRAALPLLGGSPVATINSDAVWGGSNPLALALAQWDPAVMDALMVLIHPKNAIGHKGGGDFSRAADGQLQRGAGFVYGGVQILKTDGLADIHETAFSLNRLWDDILRRGRLYGVIYDGPWCDVGHPAGLDLAERLIGGEDVQAP